MQMVGSDDRSVDCCLTLSSREGCQSRPEELSSLFLPLCGGGIRTSTREKLLAENEKGSCYGEPSVTEECNIEECPPGN